MIVWKINHKIFVHNYRAERASKEWLTPRLLWCEWVSHARRTEYIMKVVF